MIALATSNSNDAVQGQNLRRNGATPRAPGDKKLNWQKAPFERMTQVSDLSHSSVWLCTPRCLILHSQVSELALQCV